ncbi:TetR/AcrR family transcriptional regulator [Actinoallomurus rhizosphaericola]|uniref:TetR/AcrR family transcriptional regulator n=1 Tax=Actinoallomurus rhizosphaericola TaxID=2952536 RepID=UPI00209042E1|nr:TetR/AcrR family transcriptional regulator [Actinoallomurus rhizosphaericola]MCO5991974.1 TetR family transcriptional regulator [Actinoallomurus rhizosphaericola]
MSTRAEQRRNTEARILAQARRLFAETGYDRTTIRAVATAAEVDPGLVMHYFGSKEKLFARATERGTPPIRGGTPEQVAEQLLDLLRSSLADEPVESLAVLRSMLTHPEAAHEVRAASQDHFGRISAAIPDDHADLRAAVVSAVLIGVAIGRHLIKLDHLADADPDQIVEILGPSIRSLTKADD